MVLVRYYWLSRRY